MESLALPFWCDRLCGLFVFWMYRLLYDASCDLIFWSLLIYYLFLIKIKLKVANYIRLWLDVTPYKFNLIVICILPCWIIAIQLFIINYESLHLNHVKIMNCSCMGFWFSIFKCYCLMCSMQSMLFNWWSVKTAVSHSTIQICPDSVVLGWVWTPDVVLLGWTRRTQKGEKRINEDPWDLRLLGHAALFYCAMFSEILS